MQEIGTMRCIKKAIKVTPLTEITQDNNYGRVSGAATQGTKSAGAQKWGAVQAQAQQHKPPPAGSGPAALARAQGAQHLPPSRITGPMTPAGAGSLQHVGRALTTLLGS